MRIHTFSDLEPISDSLFASSQLIVTHQLPLEKVEEGIKMVLAGKDSVKVALIPPE